MPTMYVMQNGFRVYVNKEFTFDKDGNSNIQPAVVQPPVTGHANEVSRRVEIVLKDISIIVHDTDSYKGALNLLDRDAAKQNL